MLRVGLGLVAVELVGVVVAEEGVGLGFEADEYLLLI